MIDIEGMIKDGGGEILNSRMVIRRSIRFKMEHPACLAQLCLSLGRIDTYDTLDEGAANFEIVNNNENNYELCYTEPLEEVK
jgi:hypothetical protein